MTGPDGTRPLVIVGCGGHGREVLGIARAVRGATPGSPAWHVLGFVDDAPDPANLACLARLGERHLGGLDWLQRAPEGTGYVIGIGYPQVRAAVGRRIEAYGLPAASLIHPDATLGADVDVAEGVVVFPGARVTTHVTLGRHVHLNQNATVGHDSQLEEYATVNPLAAVSGGCRIGRAALVGTTAAVLQGLRVGVEAVVGAGACVVRDVPAGAVVKGVPAR